MEKEGCGKEGKSKHSNQRNCNMVSEKNWYYSWSPKGVSNDSK